MVHLNFLLYCWFVNCYSCMRMDQGPQSVVIFAVSLSSSYSLSEYSSPAPPHLQIYSLFNVLPYLIFKGYLPHLLVLICCTLPSYALRPLTQRLPLQFIITIPSDVPVLTEFSECSNLNAGEARAGKHHVGL